MVGVLAQLIERRIRIAEVAGLSPAYSTIYNIYYIGFKGLFLMFLLKSML